jgi:hypothetical protein
MKGELTEIKKKTDNSIIVFGDLNTIVPAIARTTDQPVRL